MKIENQDFLRNHLQNKEYIQKILKRNILNVKYPILDKISNFVFLVCFLCFCLLHLNTLTERLLYHRNGTRFCEITIMMQKER